MAKTALTGLPTMRPLLVDHPADPAVWAIDDQYFFGDDLMVAPVTALGARSRTVYLPQGADWRDVGRATFVPAAPPIRWLHPWRGSRSLRSQLMPTSGWTGGQRYSDRHARRPPVLAEDHHGRVG